MGVRVTLDDGVRAAASPINVDVLDLDAGVSRACRLRPAGSVSSRSCRFFGGLSRSKKPAKALGISTAATADRDWQTARAWLLKELRATP